MVHTCPRCELRFLTAAELTAHLRDDHRVDVDGLEPFHYKPLEARPPTRRYIVVGNQTLSDESLFERLREVTKDGHVHLVVPATTNTRGVDAADGDSLALATVRMRHAVDRLHALTIDAEGEVGAADPIRAVARALDHEPADEIVVLTLPRGLSKWLEVDLPKALEHRFGVPVRVLTATP